MKLIRLVSTDPNANFDNDFSSDIMIDKDSKICLHSVSFEPLKNVITIDATNDQITYNLTNTTPANTKTITLTHASYTNINFQDLLDDIETQLNNSLTLSGKQIGTQFVAYIGQTTKKAEIGYDFSPLMNDDFFDNAGCTTGANFIRSDTPAGNRTNDIKRLTSDHPIIKGAGVLRVRIKSLQDNGTGNPLNNGFTIGLSEDNPNVFGNTINKKFAIKCAGDTDNYGFYVNNILGDAGFPPENSSNGTIANNDVLEISVSENVIRGQVYRQSQADPDLLFTGALDRTVNLYPFVSFQGGSNFTEANIVRYNYDPELFRNNSTVDLNDRINEEHSNDEYTLTSTPPNVPRNSSTIFNFLMSQPLADFLGFNQIQHIKRGVFVILLADKLFTATLINDSFIIEMKNIELESYDGINNNGMRKNLLAIIPKNNSSGIVEYEPNNPYFIDMKNTQKSLRNIRARILRSDLEKVSVGGLSVLTLLIKSSNEL